MAIYKTDQCVQCGGIRVAKSSLCVTCLVACNGRLQFWVEERDTRIKINEGLFSDMVDEKNVEIDKLSHQLKLIRKILRHVFKEYQELQKLKAVDIVA